MPATQTITTAKELLEAGDIGRCELVRGKLILMSPAGFHHGHVIGRMTSALGPFILKNDLGAILGAETGFYIERNPDTVRAPDVGFVRKVRLPESDERGFYPGAPDLAVEVLSPDDRAGEVTAKVQNWLESGCRAVWVVDPRSRTVNIYKPQGEARLLGIYDTVSDDELLPGFELPVRDIFPGAAH